MFPPIAARHRRRDLGGRQFGVLLRHNSVFRRRRVFVYDVREACSHQSLQMMENFEKLLKLLL